MDSSDRVIDESTGNAPPREDDSRHSASFNVVVVVLGVALALTILLVASFEVWVFGLWFGSGQTWSGFPWILVAPPMVGLLAFGALFALWMRWAGYQRAGVTPTKALGTPATQTDHDRSGGVPSSADGGKSGWAPQSLAWPHRRSCRTAQMFRRSSDSVPFFVRTGGYGRHHPT